MPHSLALLGLAAPGTGHLRTPDLLLIAVYLLAITLFGLRFRTKPTAGTAVPKSDRSLKTYFLAGNTIPWWAIALSVVSAETSTLTIISIPGVAFAGNFGFLQIVLGYLCGRVVVAILFLPRYFAGEMLTAYQLIDRRFGPFLHKVTAGLFLLTRAAAEGVRVFAVSIVVSIAIGTGDVLSIGIISALTLLYTFEGGMAAVIWTDVVQMAIYVGGTLVALFTLGHHVPGGWGAIIHTASLAGKFQVFNFALNLTQSYTFWAGLLGGTFLTMASHGTDQLMVQRLLAARNLRESQLALLSSGVVILMQFAFFLLIGAGLWVFYGQRIGPHAAAAFRTNDYIFPTFIVREMPTGIAGLLVAAILAAAMSNLSAALNSLSSTTVVDFYIRARPLATDRERTLIAKSSTALWAIVLFAIAVYAVGVGGKGHVVEVGLSIASVAYGCLLGVFLLGTLTRFANEYGAAVGMLCGFALNLWLWQGTFPVHLGSLTIPHIAFTWFVLIGAAVTFLIGSGASLLLERLNLKQPTRVATTSVFAFVLFFCLSSRSLAGVPREHSLLAGVEAQGSAVPPGVPKTPNSANPQTSPRTPDASTKAPTSSDLKVAPSTIDFSRTSTLINEAITAHKLPGAVVIIGHAGEVVFHQAYGNRKLAGEPGLDGQPAPAEPMTEDTVFDMASLTKAIVTTTAIGQLYEAKKLDFDTPLDHYLPEFNPAHDAQRAQVTLRLLLTHYSGEPPDVDLKDPWGLAAPDKAEGLRRALIAPLAGVPGAKFVYSDINFILLGALIEKLSGQDLDIYAQSHIFQPLGMTQTAYHSLDHVCAQSFERIGSAAVPNMNHGELSQPGAILPKRCDGSVWKVGTYFNTAPTAHDDEGTPATNPNYNHLLRGTVHDPTTRRMGGVAGHAGVFSNAHDMSLFAQALLDRLAGRPSKFPLKRLTLERMTAPEQPGHTPLQVGQSYRADRATMLGALSSRLAPTDAQVGAGSSQDPLLAPNYPAIKGQTLRGYGWDIDSGYSKPRGRLLPIGSFGHTGFTGTSLWLDPYSDIYVLLLANAIHPHVGAPISNLRGEVATAAAQALGLGNARLPPTASPSALKLPALGTARNPPPPVESEVEQHTPPKPGDAHLLLTASRPSSTVDASGASPLSSNDLSGVAPQFQPTLTGIDVLQASKFEQLALLMKGRNTFRLGLLTNQTGIDVRGHRTIDILAADLPKSVPGAHLTTLFSPEHGIFGRQDTEHLHAEVDAATGLPVTSLYGAHDRDRRPSHEQLASLDAVVIDLQDVGVRFFTYETVVGYFLEAAAGERTQYHHDLELILLDRPNPLGGDSIEGPMSDAGIESYTNYMPLPVRHGLTLGELARYINTAKHLEAHLTVVPLQNWRRRDFFDDTGLPWVNPSPNLHSLTAALLYPGLALLEMTNISVGRGTATPFELFGAGVPSPTTQSSSAPGWFRAAPVAAALNARAIPGIHFSPTTIPVGEDSNHYPFHGQTIEAVHLTITDRRALNSPELGIEILTVLHRLYPTQFQLERAMRLVANQATMDALLQEVDSREIAATWQAALARFRSERQASLLY